MLTNQMQQLANFVATENAVDVRFFVVVVQSELVTYNSTHDKYADGSRSIGKRKHIARILLLSGHENNDVKSKLANTNKCVTE